MPLTVEKAFDDLIANLRSSRAEIFNAAGHRASIKAKLEQSFSMTAFFRTGSFGNGTNISGYSDVDYFAVIPTANLKADSSVTLSSIAAALRERFPLTSNIRVNGPAVQVPFGLDGAEHTEIVPVDATGTTVLGFRQFDMPDGRGGWMFSAPESHNDFVNGIDKGLSGKPHQLVRLLKAWRSYRGAAIKSFYLEMYVTQYAQSESAIVYDIDVRNVLQRLSAEGLPSIIDPRFPGDGRYLEPCQTSIQHLDALAKVQRAAGWAEDALRLKYDGQISAAFDKWNLVYNYYFPSFSG